jgi:hypothetical protein
MVGGRHQLAGMTLSNSSYSYFPKYVAIGGCGNNRGSVYPDNPINAVETFNDNYETWNMASPTTTVKASAAAGGNLVIGGYPSSGSVESYNRFDGTWSTRPNLITPRTSGHAAAGQPGTSNVVVFGGSNTEEYNGTAWAEGGALSISRYALGGAGTQNAALAFGGYSYCICTEEYNGTTWSPGGAMIFGRGDLAGGGYQDSALAFGGIYGTACSETEAYDGSNWTSKADMLLALQSLGGGAKGDGGSLNSALAFGGFQYANIYGTTQTSKYCSVNFNRSAFNFDSTNNTVATGSFLGSLRGTLDGTATHAYEANSAITATSASYVEADSVDWSALTHYTADAAAAAAGVPIGGLYRNGNFIVIRLT